MKRTGLYGKEVMSRIHAQRVRSGEYACRYGLRRSHPPVGVTEPNSPSKSQLEARLCEQPLDNQDETSVLHCPVQASSCVYPLPWRIPKTRFHETLRACRRAAGPAAARRRRQAQRLSSSSSLGRAMCSERRHLRSRAPYSTTAPKPG